MELGSLFDWTLAAGGVGSAGLLAVAVIRLRSLERLLTAELAKLPVPFRLAARPALFQIYERWANHLTKLADHPDPLLRELAAARIAAMADEVGELAQGTVVFTATETWRSAYQKVLLTSEVKSYFSVAWVRSCEYWNDSPGRQSLQLNFDLVARGFRIERVHILPDVFWDDESILEPEIFAWLKSQADKGIVVRLARESEVRSEPDLLQDFAIYGNRATAVQYLDANAKTERFILTFDPRSVRQALERWERLALFGNCFEAGLDRRTARR